MLLLGVYFGHDGNACLLRDGTTLGHVEFERTTRIGHQNGPHGTAIYALCAQAGVALHEVDGVIVGGHTWHNGADPWEPYGALRAACEAVRARAPFNYADPRDPNAHVLTTEVALAGRPVPVWFVDHHLSHVGLAYYTSPYARAKVMSWDGGGDGAFALAAEGVDGRLVRALYNPPTGVCSLSIGGTWTELARLWTENGFHRTSDYEGKIMGYAAYGVPDPHYRAIVRRYMEEYQARQRAHTLVALQRELVGLIDFSAFTSASPSGRDFAASLQAETEAVMANLLDAWAAPDDAVCLGGGCAYNCVANGKLWRRWPRLFVASCPHDGGLALGAALVVWHHVLGHAFNGAPHWSPYQGHDVGDAPGACAPRVVDDLLAGRIVAWCDGRAEMGKRALGHRSLLLDPRRADGKDHLNQRVKHREWFRPYAPSVLLGHDAWCAGPVPPSPYMSFSCDVAPAWRERVPAVVHVDGTCRPQVVDPVTNPTFATIVQGFHDATGVPMVLNTSFNVQEPIVDTAAHAHRTFAQRAIDVLYVAGKRFAKP